MEKKQRMPLKSNVRQKQQKYSVAWKLSTHRLYSGMCISFNYTRRHGLTPVLIPWSVGSYKKSSGVAMPRPTTNNNSFTLWKQRRFKKKKMWKDRFRGHCKTNSPFRTSLLHFLQSNNSRSYNVMSKPQLGILHPWHTMVTGCGLWKQVHAHLKLWIAVSGGKKSCRFAFMSLLVWLSQDSIRCILQQL